MALKILNCEEENIHLCGKIQNFGYLIVFDLEQKCIAISENCNDWLTEKASLGLHQKLNYFLPFIKDEDNKNSIKPDILLVTKHSTSYKVFLGRKKFQLSTYTLGNHLFFEFEENENNKLNLSELNSLQSKFEHTDNLWQALCESIYKINGFDRIMIYQFMADDSGMVIAEKTTDRQVEKLLGYRYPEFDIPKQARELYLKNHSRQVPDIFADTVSILGLEPSQIDLTNSQIRALSPIHLQYLQNFGVRASSSFSIIIDEQLWGLVICQHFTPKYISYDNRCLSLFITQYAANKYSAVRERLNLQQIQSIKELELELKEKLYSNMSWENTLKELAPQLISKLCAHGLIIKSPEYCYKIGETPHEAILHKIHAAINKESGDKNIFKTHEFTLDTYSGLNNSNWAGIARITLDKEHNHVIYFFRKEITIQKKYAGLAEKYPIYSEEKKAYVYSPRTSFQLWINEIKGQSEKWSTFDNEFLSRIYKLVQKSIIQKINVVKLLNEKLIETNNKLDTYTHQLAHELKNPLTTIKINAQFIQLHQDMSREKINQFMEKINDSTKLICEIITKTLESTKSTPNMLVYETINTNTIIRQTINEALEAYNTNKCEVQLGELHPIYGERTLLYQLFMNLINNAIKFSSKQELTILNIYSNKEKNNTVYFIKDNGIGINDSEQKEIFSMFKRLSNASQYEGSGIGMSIVKRIVDRLKATITIESQVNVGTTFKISFPNE